MKEAILGWQAFVWNIETAQLLLAPSMAGTEAATEAIASLEYAARVCPELWQLELLINEKADEMATFLASEPRAAAAVAAASRGGQARALVQAVTFPWWERAMAILEPPPVELIIQKKFVSPAKQKADNLRAMNRTSGYSGRKTGETAKKRAQQALRSKKW